MFLFLVTMAIVLGSLRVGGVCHPDYRFAYARWIGFYFGGGLTTNQPLFVAIALVLLMIEFATSFRTRVAPWLRGLFHRKGAF